MSKLRIRWNGKEEEEGPVASPDTLRRKREEQVLNLVCRTLQEYPEAYRAVQETIRRVYGNDDEGGRGHGKKTR
jgi:hypothetical protein